MWGIARLPTAFIPNEDQGYLMIAAQLPDAASLGRTTAALDRRDQAALATPGVENVDRDLRHVLCSTISPISPMPASSLSSSSRGIERSKANGTDILSIAEHLQAKLNGAPDGRLFVLAPPPIQGIGNAGGFQMQTEMLGRQLRLPEAQRGDRGRSSKRPMPSPGCSTS